MPASSQLTNITLAEAADSGSWSDIGGGQGSLQDDGNPVQGTEDRARRVDNAIRGFSFDNSVGIDLSASGMHVGQWMNVLQKGKLNADSIECIYSSGTAAKGTPWAGHVFPASSFRKTEDYKRIWVDLSRTPEFSAGTLALTAIRFFGGEADVQDVGGNAPNFKQDRKDYGTEGILINGGTIGTPSTFAEAVTIDNINSLGIIDNDFLDGPVKIGGANTYFKDTVYNLKAGNQPIAATDWIKVIFDIQQSTSELFPQGIGFFGGITLEILGSSGTLDLGTQTIEGSPDFVLNAQVTFGGFWINGGELDWNGADLRGLNITNSSPILVDESTSFVDLFENMTFTSGGTGHGLKLEEGVPVNINLKNINWNGYGADTTTDAAIWYDGTTPIEITYEGGNKPTVRGANITVLDAQVTITFTGLQIGGEFRIYDDDGDGNEITLGTNREGIESLLQNFYTFIYPITDAGNIIRAQFMDPLNFEEQVLKITLPSVSQSIEFSLIEENNV